MTAVDVDALAKLREAATPGEWRHDPRIAGPGVIHGSNGAPVVSSYGGTVNAALIVAAVNALAPLLAEVRRGRALRDKVVGTLQAYDHDARYEHDVGHTTATDLISDLRAALAAVDGGGQQ
jgi:hypothetical protein